MWVAGDKTVRLAVWNNALIIGCGALLHHPHPLTTPTPIHSTPPHPQLT